MVTVMAELLVDPAKTTEVSIATGRTTRVARYLNFAIVAANHRQYAGQER
jgi:hypothetical protein